MSRIETPLQQYITSQFAPQDALLERVRAAGELQRQGLQVSAGEGKLLGMFAQMIGARRILEIGSFVGYSAICMARALPQGGELITLEQSPDYADLAQAHFDASGLPITLLRGLALEQLPKLTGSFDMVFIDADKLHYAAYLEATLPLLREGGLMIGDNTLLFGAVMGEPTQMRVSPAAIDAMRRFNARMNDGNPLSGVMIPTEEGLTVAIKGRSGA